MYIYQAEVSRSGNERKVLYIYGIKAFIEYRYHRLFYKNDLAKMKTVYPTALLLAQQTHIPGGYGREIFNSYQLTIECNLTELADDGQPAISSSTHLASSILLRRRQKFKRNLLNMVKKHHGVHKAYNVIAM